MPYRISKKSHSIYRVKCRGAGRARVRKTYKTKASARRHLRRR